MHIKDLLKHMEIEINGSKLTKWNYVSVFDSAVVENQNVVNKLETKTGFPCIPSNLRKWGGEGRLRGGGHLINILA